ncbi:replicative DNA helicase [Nonomuraea sp. LP-02]|nr:replicative DNA helicase [Nonomuraea sp. LP-02]MED7928558.1 replicative DNA helicase [Nonomuraea sp. LP-02]
MGIPPLCPLHDMQRQLSFLHSRWTTFPQVGGLPTEIPRSYPQASSTGISHVGGRRTQLDHRVVHRPRWRPGLRSGKLSDRSTTSGGGATACKAVRGGAVSIDEEIPAGPGFERTPPHNIEAEQSVLGGMLLSKDAIADVVEIIRADDFYRPAHQMVYEVITDLYGRGEPADAVTVFDELQKRGEMARVGGAAYLHTLTAVVPTAANAGYYAKIVREQAILRRLIEAGTRIVSYGYGGQNEEVDDLVDRAQAEIYKVTERRTSEDYAPLADIMPGALDELEAIGSRGGQMVGVPTGFQDLDQLTNGLHPGQMIVVAARPAIGKALALDTPLPTPTGWTTMGEVQPGDYLVGADGKPTRVVAATDVMHGRPCYEVEFSDGTVIVADAQHQWLTDTRASRKSAQAAAAGYNRHKNQRTFAQVRTTEEIAATLRCDTAEKRLNHTVVNARPLQLPDQDLLIPPYALGVWLGDGNSGSARFTTADPEIADHVAAEGLRVEHRGELLYAMLLPEPEPIAERQCIVCDKPFTPQTSQVRTCGRVCGCKSRGSVHGPSQPPRCPDCGGPSSGMRLCQGCHDDHGTMGARLRKLGVLNNKHIPGEYLRASEEQRRALLAGLLDTDGYVNTSGTVQFAVTNRRLAEDAWELILSLGYKANCTSKRVAGRSETSSTSYTITFTPSDKVFRLERKNARVRTNAHPKATYRNIVDARPVPSVPVRCVEVDNADHMYLAGRTWIPTHNSTLGLDFARSAAIKNGMTTVIFSLEMSRNEITMRLLSAEARVALHAMRSGMMGDDDWTRLARRMSEVAEAPLFIDDSPNMSMMEIRAKCRRLKQRNDLRFVVIDYLQLMSSPKKTESRQNEVSEISRAIKLLAKELEVPVIAISQLNRGPEQRTDKRPQVSDLRESGCLTAGTRVLRADTGAEATLGELLESGARDVPVWSLDENLRLVPRTMTHVFPSGTKEVFRLRLSSGREIEATANHPFMTFDGWRPLGELAPGARVAAPRHVSAPRDLQEWPDDQVVLHAHLTREGRAVPEEVFSLPKRQIALFLRHLWASDGDVQWDDELGEARLSCTSASRRLVDDVARLLLRFNVMTRIEEVRQAHRLRVTGADNQLRFLDEIGVPGERFEQQAGRCAAALRQLAGDTDAGTVPSEVWDRVGDSLAVRAAAKGAPGPERLRRISTILDDADLELLATNDVFWDEVASVESLGEQPVYDATVLGTHNFVANGISVHNSIEQDADMVILLHREDAYERESPRAGEADLIVAKHRNGPTATVTVAFQGHYSRFVDMAQH